MICVGSVWKSWQYMEKGFTDEIHEAKLVDELTLMTLIAPSAIGACYAAGEKMACDSLVTTPDEHTKAFFHYKRHNIPVLTSTSTAGMDPACDAVICPTAP